MPETPEELWERVHDALRVEDWGPWPFEGELSVRRLEPPVERERRARLPLGRRRRAPHWWFMARPARLPQLIGSFASIWDDILPPTPQDVWRADLDALRAALDS